MSHTLTIRLTEELAQWLAKTSKRTHLAKGRIVRDELERARKGEKQGFLRLAGGVSGPKDLSGRRGFSRP